VTDDYSLLKLGHLWARHRRVTIGLPLLLAVLTGIVSLLVPPTYTATTTFVPEASPQAGRLSAGLAGLASQFGVSVGGDASKSPKFYAQVLRSRELMEHVLLSKYLDPRSHHTALTDSATLLSVLGVNGRDSADSLARAISKLGGLLEVNVNSSTNIVSLSVDAHNPGLAAAVANRFVDYLNAFNTQHRQSQAREERRFVEERLADGERGLRSAEEDLRTFYERNRSWQQAPQLTFEEGRLRRQVEIRQEVYLTLNREYETARMQEVNDTPVITVIDAATPPVRKSRPKRTLLVAIALVLGGMVGSFWAAGVEYLELARQEQ